MDIAQFKKQKKETPKMITVSARITQEQKQYIDQNDLNLSMIIRHALQTLMTGENEQTAGEAAQPSEEESFELEGVIYHKGKVDGKVQHFRGDEPISRHVYGRARKRLR